MKANYPVLYLLLFLVMITGTLASMALNGYGMKLMGIGSVGFAFVFLHELLVHRDLNMVRRLELGLLAVICLLLACRNFFIEIPSGQMISAVLIAFLTGLYVYYGQRMMRKVWPTNRPVALGMLGYYGAVISFLTGFLSGLVSIAPDYGTFSGIAFLALFAGTHLMNRAVLFDGEKTTILQISASAKNKSTVVLVALLAAGFFYTLIQIQVLPPLYAGDVPVGYSRLVQRAEGGQDPMAAKGNPRHREFRKAYQQFLQRTQQ